MNNADLLKHNLQPLEVDCMPADSALEQLTAPGVKMSSSFRRTCMRARESYYVSTNVPKPAEIRLARKFSGWGVGSLVRQSRRTEQRIRIANGQISRIKVDFIKAELVQNIMLPLLDVHRALRAEITRRGHIIAAVVQSRRVNAKDS